jgi:PAS domain S-box-containing protein
MISSEHSRALKNPLKLSFIYFFFGIFWMLTSDALLNSLLPTTADVTYFQILKGLTFVIVTTIFLFFLSKNFYKKTLNFISVLEESERKYKPLFDNNPSPMWVFDIETNQFVDVNNAAVISYGYTREEFLGMTIFDVRPDEDKEKLSDHLSSGEKGYDLGEHWRHLRKDGAIIDVQVFAHSVNYNGKKCRLIQAIDITERKKSERELLESEERYRIVTEKATDAIYIRTEDEYIFMNQSGLDLFGFSSFNDLKKLKPSRFLHSDFEYKTYSDMLKSAEKSPHTRTEEKFFRIDDSEIDVEVIRIPFIYENRPVIQVIARDITEKKKYEKEILEKSFELEKRNKELRCLYQLTKITSDDNTIWEDDLSEIVKLIPPAFQFPERAYAKIRVNECISESGILAEDNVGLKSNIFLRNEICGEVIVGYTGMDISNLSSFLKEEEELLDGIAGHIADTIEKKEALKDIYELNEELEQRVFKRTLELEAVNKELESFSYSVSHDLRAPIRAIDGFAKILHSEYSGLFDDEGKRLIGKINDNASRMGNLVDDLLSFARLTQQSLNEEKIDIEKIVNESFSEIKDFYPDQEINFVVHKLPPAIADRKMIKQVWINLISNALKFSSKKDKSEIIIGFENMNGKSCYYIKDNGVGFNMEYKDKLFGIFQRLHSSNEFEGTGIGLALCYKIITRHGGNLDVEAMLNEGAKFYFSL